MNKSKWTNIFLIEPSKRVAKQNCNPDGTLLWLEPTPLWPYKHWYWARSTELSWPCRGSAQSLSWSRVSQNSQGLSKPANTHVCNAQRASAAHRAWAGPSLLRAQPFTPRENAKALIESFPELGGIPTGVNLHRDCTHPGQALAPCVRDCECATENGAEMLLPDS